MPLIVATRRIYRLIVPVAVPTSALAVVDVICVKVMRSAHVESFAECCTLKSADVNVLPVVNCSVATAPADDDAD